MESINKCQFCCNPAHIKCLKKDCLAYYCSLKHEKEHSSTHIIACGKNGYICGGCNALFPNKLSICSGCNNVQYCSKQCQKNAWKGHKLLCDKSKAKAELYSRDCKIGRVIVVSGQFELAPIETYTPCYESMIPNKSEETNIMIKKFEEMGLRFTRTEYKKDGKTFFYYSFRKLKKKDYQLIDEGNIPPDVIDVTNRNNSESCLTFSEIYYLSGLWYDNYIKKKKENYSANH